MKKSGPRSQKIRVKPDGANDTLVIRGWLSPEHHSYLWFGVKDITQMDGTRFAGTLGGQKLYRLAKAIVRRFEAANG